MEATISLTSKWQIHIPKKMRSVLGSKKPGMVKIKAEKNKLTISPARSPILELGGKYHHYHLKHKDVDIDNIRDYIDYSEA
ncbi:hypothetical protein A3D77_00545 [Candidatus Gottesmanbacteria bacterium RIFCSPHIGHO2_02_FULL_39_11]|uniref:SpoVT-AbrB domain-containing protein n=1 Tax=Candidatus Gottesmanbacteria bacterium RIFCSPHIGHO2_02_FULL_39_11 TaxID=1798382 RepID=A0A1F5ZLI4_9BACT|nr:MAG: hypothetical protein A3D77_00545 [Candidatus Gottesmanbacteria bacterium RIFCSPHIGHO2_02_FULL_39_11]